VIEWAPSARLEVLIAAEPAESAAVPRDVAPSKNSTVPVAEEGVTVAVSDTLWPTTDGFGELVTDVDDDAWFTVCECTADVLPLKLALPE